MDHPLPPLPSKRSPHLERLVRVLEYEPSGVVFIAFFIMSRLAGILFTCLAFVFSCYMLYVLYEEGRRGWILAFALCVIAPAIGFYVIELDTSFIHVLRMLPAAFFLLYCFFLRLAIREWND